MVLFAPDLVAFALGNRWDPAVPLLQGLAVAGLLAQLGFNWFSFYRAHGDPRPPAIEAVVAGVAFLVLAVPGLALWGVDGFVAGRVAAVALALVWRARYVRALLPGVRLGQLVGGALPPLLAATAVVLVLRLALWGGARGLGQALVEAGLFCAVFAGLAARRERALLAELRGSFGRAGAGEQGAGQDDGDERERRASPSPSRWRSAASRRPGRRRDPRRGRGRPGARPGPRRATEPSSAASSASPIRPSSANVSSSSECASRTSSSFVRSRSQATRKPLAPRPASGWCSPARSAMRQ